MSTMEDVLTEVRFWTMVTGLQRKTVVCSPENESRVKGFVDARDLGHVITVVVNPVVRDDQLIVMDVEGIEADLRQSMIRSTTQLAAQLLIPPAQFAPRQPPRPPCFCGPEARAAKTHERTCPRWVHLT